MKMLVRDEKTPVPEDKVYFWLEQNSDGVLLRAQLDEENPYAYCLLKIYNSGEVVRFSGVSSVLGIPLYEFGKVKIT